MYIYIYTTIMRIKHEYRVSKNNNFPTNFGRDLF